MDREGFFSKFAMLDLKTVILSVTFTLSLTKVKTFLLSLLLEKEKRNLVVVAGFEPGKFRKPDTYLTAPSPG